MNSTQRETLRDLLRRVDEVRGLSAPSESVTRVDPDNGDALLATLHDLLDELERSHRRVIETNVQLVSLREVASGMVGAIDSNETTRLVTHYLCRAFGFQEGFLLLINRETGRLEGTWTHAGGSRERSFALELPLLGDYGSIARALWLNRTVVHHTPRRHRPALVPEGHPLHEIQDQLGSTVAVPLLRSHSVLPSAEPREMCGARCMLGDLRLIAPPPGLGAESWAYDREERQRTCLQCDLMPLLGVIGMARRIDAPRVNAADVMLIESIALSVAPMVENARLYQDLRRSERFRNHVLDSMASALVAVNMRGEILTFNRAAEALLGHPEAEVLGQPFGARFGTDGDALLRATLEHGREVERVETMLRGRDGAPIPVSLTTSLLRNDRRSVYGAIATFFDLTPLKRAEERARQLDRLAALGRFTSSVAHEIRNPLTGIGAGVQYLARAIAEGDAQHENLRFIQREIRRLDRIVQDLFEVTHPRRLELRLEPLADTVSRAGQCLAALYEERGVQLELDVPARLPLVPHDLDQLEQVFINLLKNAAEASPSGGVVRVRATSPGRRPGLGATTPASQHHPPPDGVAAIEAGPARLGSAGDSAPPARFVTIRVEDQGSGIAPEALEKLFEPFFTTKQGGTGLGLYITHDIVKRHGGNLTVESEPGRGTRFTVELPVESNGGIS